MIQVFLCAVFLAYATFVQAETPKFTRQITIDEGLSQSTVSGIYQAHDGRVWFATGDGISIYDGQNFQYIYREDAQTGLQSNYIRAITEGPQGNIWVGTLGGGISVFSQTGTFLWGYLAKEESAPRNDIFDFAWRASGQVMVASAGGVMPIDATQEPLPSQILPLPEAISSIPTRALVQLSDSELLLGTPTDGLRLLNTNNNEEISFTQENSALRGSRIMDLFQDSAGGVWIGTEDGGLNHFDPLARSVSQPILLPDSDIESIAQGDDGRLWFGSWSNGVFVYDPKSGNIENYRSRTGQKQRLSSNTITSIYAGRTGYMWLGSYDGGVNLVSQLPDIFETYYSDAAGEKGPVSGVIWAITEGIEDDLWIGSKSGLSRFLQNENRFEPIDLGEGSSDVRAILRRDDHLLLAVRNRGLLSYNWQSDDLRDVSDAQGNNIFAEQYIRLLMEDRAGNIWVGTHSGVYRLTPDFEIVLHISSETDELKLPHDRIRSLYEAPNGIVWIGSSGGLTRFDPEIGSVQNYSGRAYFDDNDVRAVWQHPNGNLYIATQAGFSILDSDMNLLRQVQRKDGLPNETLYSLLPDQSGNLWMMTNNGLVRYAPDSEEIEVFRTRDGLQGAEFNFNAYASLSDGRITVGGINGFSIFNPQALQTNMTAPIVTLTTESLEGDIAPASLTLSATVAHFGEPEKNRFRWIVEPLDTNWRENMGSNHVLTREGLPAGEYTLRYQGVSAAGAMGEAQEVSFTIVKPWYLRWYMLAVYALALITSALLITKLRTRNLKQRAVALEGLVEERSLELRAVNARLAEMYDAQSKFYARASHEIRTPLALMQAPLQSIAQSPSLSEKDRSLLMLVTRAVKRLSGLTQEMAGASERERSEKITPSSIDVLSFIEPIIALYEESARSSDIRFHVEVNFDGAATLDSEALEIILHNLLSNAVKNTSKNKEIWLRIDTMDDALKVRVKNDAQLPEDTAHCLQSGLIDPLPKRGCQIIAAMVHRSGSDIRVTCEPAEVEICLPAHLSKTSQQDANGVGLADGIKILIVEDDRELREYLTSELQEFGAIHAVASSSAAKRALDTQLFHLILCDVMLPDGNGFDLIKNAKENPDTSHIPVIFLTALSDANSHKKGLEAWADDYITKPFDLETLKAKLRIRLRNIEALRTHLRHQNDMPTNEPEQPMLAPADQRLVACIEEAITGGLDEIGFAIDDVSKHCAISKRGLQRKLDALYGMSFSDLLLQRRMEHAAKLLKSGATVKETCRACGYSHASSFSRRFRQHFGMHPGEYAKNQISHR